MRATPIIIAAALVACSSLAAAQGWSSVNVDNTPSVTGNGRIVTQQRPIGDFREISLRGASDLVVRVGPRASLTVTADSNILPLLTNQIRGDKLILDARQSYRTRTQPHYVVTVPDLHGLGIAGSGDARIEGVANRRLALAIHGSGDLVASGRTGVLDVAISGSGNADTRALRADRVAATIAGSGDIRVSTNGAISGAIAGSGNIRYVGRPSAIAVTRAGSGSVLPLR